MKLVPSNPSTQHDSKKNDELSIPWKYLTLGRSIIPTGKGPKGKRPHLPSWAPYQHRLPLEDDVLRWAEQFSPSSWGMVAGPVSGITVVDCDTSQAAEIFTSRGLEPHISTPRGGSHFYLAEDLPTGIRTIDGIRFEVRGAGAYCNFTGSTPSGTYTTHQIALDGPEALWHLSDVGAGLERVLRGITGPRKATGKARIPPGPVYEGHRHTFLMSVAGAIRNLTTEQEGRDALMTLNNVRCRPPLDFEEVMAIADSAARYGYREEHVTVISDTFMQALSRVRVSPAAYRVLMALTHKTIGYGKVNDTISRSQLEAATGLLGPNVSRAVAELRAANIIEVETKYRGPSTYAVLHPGQWAV